jgi:hypothetical protein
MWRVVNHEDYSLIPNGCYDGVYTYLSRGELEIFAERLKAVVDSRKEALVTDMGLSIFKEHLYLLSSCTAAYYITGGILVGVMPAIIIFGTVIIIDEVASYIETIDIGIEAWRNAKTEEVLKNNSSTSLFRFKGKTLNLKISLEPIY